LTWSKEDFSVLSSWSWVCFKWKSSLWASFKSFRRSSTSLERAWESSVAKLERALLRWMWRLVSEPLE